MSGLKPAAAVFALASPLMLAFGAMSMGIASTAASGQTPPPSSIYTCDVNGKKVTSDRPIAECASTTQRQLNLDGSVRRIVQPTRTADEQSDYEAREHDAAIERASRQEAIRRDRNLLSRFPDETAHRKAREEALETVRKGLRQSETRLAALAVERKPLNDEAEFYVGKQLPFKLKLQIDANDASVDAQKSLLQNQQLEVARIDARYDAELERLKKLWLGAQPGSLGVIAGAASSPPLRK